MQGGSKASISMQGGSKRSVSMQGGSKASDIVETILKHAPGRLDEVENQRVVDLVLNAYLSNLTSAANVTFVGQDVTGAKRVLHVCASVSVLLYQHKVSKLNTSCAIQDCQTVAREQEKIISQSGIPVVLVDTTGRVNEWNDSMAKITGFKKKDVLGLMMVDEVFGGKLELNRAGIDSSDITRALRKQFEKVSIRVGAQRMLNAVCSRR